MALSQGRRRADGDAPHEGRAGVGRLGVRRGIRHRSRVSAATGPREERSSRRVCRLGDKAGARHDRLPHRRGMDSRDRDHDGGGEGGASCLCRSDDPPPPRSRARGIDQAQTRPPRRLRHARRVDPERHHNRRQSRRRTPREPTQTSRGAERGRTGDLDQPAAKAPNFIRARPASAPLLRAGRPTRSS
jgi:hypothetical protein